MTKQKLNVWLPLLMAVVMVVGMMVGYQLRDNSGVKSFFSSGKRSSIQEVLDLVKLHYVDDVKVDSIGSKAINDLLHQLDPHSVYIPASDLIFVNDDLRGNFSGIGVEFQLFYDTVNVLNVLPGGPSEKAGLQVGDKFLKVNDSISIAGKGLKPDDIRRLLRGERGSTVKLTILRGDKTMPVSIARGNIAVPTVDVAYMITPETGFIHINKFGESTYREFMESLEKLQKMKMKKLILDLRGNPGGFLDQAVNMADEFLDEDKMIVYTQGSHAARTEYHCKRYGLFETGKLVMLIDEGSASASEVLSGALQDWDRATIIGRRSFGKGLVQEQFGLNDGSALRLTVARYYSPLGRNIQKPYTDGYDKYEEEVSKRFQDGEIIKGDTATKKGPSFKTKKGHVVYGGGGITPDITIHADTTGTGKEAMQLYMKGTLSNFAYTYYIQHRQFFGEYKTPNELIEKYKAGESEWAALKVFSVKDSIDLNKINAKEKANIVNKIPSLIARQIWRTEGYYKATNQTDSFVVKALEILKN